MIEVYTLQPFRPDGMYTVAAAVKTYKTIKAAQRAADRAYDKTPERNLVARTVYLPDFSGQTFTDYDGKVCTVGDYRPEYDKWVIHYPNGDGLMPTANLRKRLGAERKAEASA